MADDAHRPVRHHPETGHIAINFGKQIAGGGQHWLYLHLDDRGDVIATPKHHSDVEDWPELSPDPPGEGHEDVTAGDD